MYKYNFLVDSHCHLNYLEKDFNIDNVVDTAKNNGVNILNNICGNIYEAENVIKLSEKYKNVFCSVGHHPEEILEKFPTTSEIIANITSKKVIAIGESGLDYYYMDKSTRKKQIDNFVNHIEACRKTNLPLIIHSRNADQDMINILKSEMKNGEFSFVLHCFCSSKDLAYCGLDLNGFISFSGIVTFKNAVNVQNIAQQIPLDRILVETDSPYLAPVPLRGKINQPVYVKYVAEFLAKLLNKDFDEIKSITTENFFKLFNIDYVF